MRTGTMLLVLWLAGCVSTTSRPATMQRPTLLETVAFEVNPDDVYEEAFTLGFEQGFQVAYASPEERMLILELPTPSGLLDVGTAWVHRVGLYVRDRAARGVLYVRYYSYDPEKGTIRVADADREVAEIFLATLKERLMPASQL